MFAYVLCAAGVNCRPRARQIINMDEVGRALAQDPVKENGSPLMIPRSWRVYNSNGRKNKWKQGRSRSRSINPPTPAPQFGCKGHLLEDGVAVQNHVQVDPAEHFLDWTKPPVTVLVIKKMGDGNVTRCFKELTRWLIVERKMEVYVEKSTLEEPSVVEDEEFKPIRSNFCFKEGDNVDDKIDLVLCLGGDGTLLHVSTLFQRSCPPVMAFHLGSLGFLTPFKFEDFKSEIAFVLEGNPGLTLRSRLKCEIIRTKLGDSRNMVEEKHLVLNEVVLDRGSSSFLTNLDISINGNFVTSVQGDGLIISTPTGSTAYAVAAGASMVHPNIPAILITPVCPHSLSFRPIMVPAGVELEVTVNPEGRSNAWASFDGRNRHVLEQGESLRITTSIYPVPSINSTNQITDWFDSLGECLHWNVRQRQRALNRP